MSCSRVSSVQTRALASTALAAAVACGCGSSTTDLADAPGGNGGRASGGGSGRGASGGSAGTVIVPPMDAGVDDGGCHRDVSLQAVTLGEPAPFDLVIVADHSESLAWSRDELARGLQNLLVNVEGREVRVFVLTPTQYGESSSVARVPLSNEPVVPWLDPATDEAYQHAVTTYAQTCTAPEGPVIDCPSPLGPTPYRVEGTWSLTMPDPIAVIRSDMTSTEFRAEQDALAQAILAIGGTGSPNEQPLCTLSRYISQDPGALPQNATFLVISDEDDVSRPIDCLAGFRGELRVSRNETGTTPCSSDCDAYRFSMTGDSFSTGFRMTCTAFDDLGDPIPGTEQVKYASQSGVTSCEEVVVGPCSEAEKQTLAWVCDTGAQITSCSRECSMSNNAQCRVDLTTPDVNACTDPFSYAGRTWDNLASYCATRGSGWHTCAGGGVNISYRESLGGSASRLRLMPGETTADVTRYFRTKANAVFQPDAYMVAALLFDPAFSCTLGPGQSHATNLVELVGDRGRIFPLCESYAPALDGVLDFAQALIQTRFSLDLADDEYVTQVVVTDRHLVERNLASGDYSYDRSARLLTVSRDAIRATDETLRVEITSDCRPEPR